MTTKNDGVIDRRPLHFRLTPMEYQIFIGIATDKTTKQMRIEGNLGDNAICNAITRIKAKTGWKGPAEMAVYAHKAGIGLL